MPKSASRTVDSLPDLIPRLLKAQGFAEVVQSLQNGESAAVDGAWGSACALTIATLNSVASKPLLVVLPRVRDVERYADDLEQLGVVNPFVFPAWETLPEEHDVSDSIFGSRLRVLNDLENVSGPQVVVTSFPAILQPVPDRADRDAGTRTLKVGDEVELEGFMQWLVERGFERVTAIQFPGEFSMHGGILDIFAPATGDPLRFEFFGDEIESIRRFDVETQRRLEDLQQTDLSIVSPIDSQSGKSKIRAHEASLLDSLPKGSWVVLTELQETVDEGKLYLNRLHDARGLFSVNAALSKCTDFPSVTISTISADSLETSCHLQVESIERFTGAGSSVLAEMAEVVGPDERVLVACFNESERNRLAEILHEAASQEPQYGDLAERIRLCTGRLSRGFRMVRDRQYIISDHELFGRTDAPRRKTKKRRAESRAIDSFLDLNEGDLVVHLTNGIGRYCGMKLLEKDEQVEEHLTIEFRDGIRVFVPVSLIHLVQKYVGAAKGGVKLSKLGSASWAKKKQKVAEAITDMASDMLQLQAERELKPGMACAADSAWQDDFAAAFPYQETDDQLAAIADLTNDMELSRPMDRLICGDVGYGKTEVAMRAAFKCVDNGRQVAVLVPTTVLAEQHYRSFVARMAEYPINIEMLSRFRTKAEQRQILSDMETGAVDIVIGTHRIVQKDVRFKDIGLLIVDEEQRFGVGAKEMLKLMRLEIDVLTLSATPIPRTLHMSLLGIRDISNLTTAPQERQPIETRVTRFDPELIRSAVVRELNRNGQVFFVHNRVHNIQTIKDRLQQIVPEAKIGIVHGQMKETELEAAMVDFVTGRSDVLIATTIIESGLDIPNANTIFIHEADNYGLADLHQLRGRVGRYRHRAYCYLLLKEGKRVSTIAAKRLKAIEEYSELGAGFKISMRDLEIRGAGNILGTEQSGHISAVGYELYCQLLENAVRRLKNEPSRQQPHIAIDLPTSAFLPNSFVPAGRQKIEIYRRLSNLASLAEVDEFTDELTDRFGTIPEEAMRLLRIREIQVLATEWTIKDIHLEDGFVYFGYRNPHQIEKLAALCGPKRLRIADKNSAYLVIQSDEDDGEALIDELRHVLSLHSNSAAARV